MCVPFSRPSARSFWREKRAFDPLEMVNRKGFFFFLFLNSDSAPVRSTGRWHVPPPACCRSQTCRGYDGSTRSVLARVTTRSIRAVPWGAGRHSRRRHQSLLRWTPKANRGLTGLSGISSTSPPMVVTVRAGTRRRSGSGTRGARPSLPFEPPRSLPGDRRRNDGGGCTDLRAQTSERCADNVLGVPCSRTGRGAEIGGQVAKT